MLKPSAYAFGPVGSDSTTVNSIDDPLPISL
jgi:hypothetical protein